MLKDLSESDQELVQSWLRTVAKHYSYRPLPIVFDVKEFGPCAGFDDGHLELNATALTNSGWCYEPQFLIDAIRHEFDNHANVEELLQLTPLDMRLSLTGTYHDRDLIFRLKQLVAPPKIFDTIVKFGFKAADIAAMFKEGMEIVIFGNIEVQIVGSNPKEESDGTP